MNTNKRPNSSLTSSELQLKKQQKRAAKLLNRSLKAGNRSRPSSSSWHVNDLNTRNAQILTSNIAQMLFSSAPPSRETLTPGNELLQEMTKKNLKSSSMSSLKKLWGYTRQKFSSRILLLYNSLTMLKRVPDPDARHRFTDSLNQVDNIVSIGAGPCNDIIGVLIYKHFNGAEGAEGAESAESAESTEASDSYDSIYSNHYNHSNHSNHASNDSTAAAATTNTTTTTTPPKTKTKTKTNNTTSISHITTTPSYKY
jgi:hypothetical protein